METVDTQTLEAADPADAGDALGLVVLWARDELHRSGEILFVRTETPLVIGREGRGAVGFLRQRPGRNLPTGPLTSSRISRRQLRVKATAGGLHVENLGSAPMRVEGRARQTATLTPGAMVTVERRLVLRCVRRPIELPGPAPARDHTFGGPDAWGIVGESPAVWALRAQLAFVAARDAHVLVLGESGTGKELAAQALHAGSRRSRGPFVSRNAATLPEGLADAELFGNARNYPNPGLPARPGLVGAANRGTLFLDELGEMPTGVQAHLLRVLDAGEYTRLGESEPRRTDLRFVGATNRDPSELKHDVLARLKIRVQLPGLGDRRDDVVLLAQHLLRSIARRDAGLAERFFVGGTAEGAPRIGHDLAHRLAVHPYTTHVRELESLLWDAMTTSPGDTLVSPEGPIAEQPVDALGPEAIRNALREADGVKARAAELLGLRNRFQLLRLMKRHGLA